MSTEWAGAIDCDVHPRVPNIRALQAHMDEYWRDTVELRGIEGFESIAYPANAPLTIRSDWREGKVRADEHVERMGKALLDRHGFAHAICNCLYAVQMIRDEHMAAAFARAVNDWVKAEWLDKDARLRASIVVPVQNPELAVEEIERCAPDKRFVQVLFLAMGELPLGKSYFWPIHRAAERHDLTIGIHAGSSYHHAITGSGWPSYYLEDYAAQSLGFHTQLGSLISEGVFVKFPKLKVVLIEFRRELDWPVPVAPQQVLARGAQRGALDRPLAQRVRARSYPPDDPAVRRAGVGCRGGPADRPAPVGRNVALFL